MQFGKKKHTSEFFKDLKVELEGRVLFVAFEKPRSAWFFQILREITLLFVNNVWMRKFGQCIYNIRVCCAPSTPRNFGSLKRFVRSLILEIVNL